MKRIETEDIEKLPGRRLGPDDTFTFRCHPRIACFNQCCRNLNLFLYPYDVLRVRKRLQLTSDQLVNRHLEIVMREGSYFPDVLLRMADNAEKTCPFLTAEGCGVYPDRPWACRTFPLEQGLLIGDETRSAQMLYFWRPPDFCLGPGESACWTPASWNEDQQTGDYNHMMILWTAVKRLFESDPWGAEGPYGRKAKMAFMAVYNIDAFREFIFGSTFLKRYKVKKALQQNLLSDDTALLKFGMAWIRLFLFGVTTPDIRPQK